MQDEFLSAPVHAQKMSLLITEDRVFIFLSIIHGHLCHLCFVHQSYHFSYVFSYINDVNCCITNMASKDHFTIVIPWSSRLPSYIMLWIPYAKTHAKIYID